MSNEQVELIGRKIAVPHGVIEIRGRDGTVIGYAVDERAHTGVMTPRRMTAILKEAMEHDHG